MIKRIEKWLASLFRAELATATAEITALRAEVTALREHVTAAAKDVQMHAESVASELFEDVKNHAEGTAATLHAKVSEDARTILKFQQTTRMGCSWCGQLTRTYIIDPVTAKIKCADCQKKGVE